MKPNCLIISYSNISSDPRILRQIDALRDNYRIFTLSKDTIHPLKEDWTDIQIYPKFSIKRKIKRGFQFFFRFYVSYYFDSYKLFLIENYSNIDFKLIVANDIMTLPLALKLAKVDTKIYFDAHEFHLSEYADNLFWRLFHLPYIRFLCVNYIPKVNYFSTVSERICDLYNEQIGIKPFLVSNSTTYCDLKVNEIGEKIKVIHHGACFRSRKLELMLEVAKLCQSRFQFDFMLVKSDENYYKELLKLSQDIPNVRFIDPVPFHKIPSTINSYDLGIYLLPPLNKNALLAMPNKLFEFVQSRLCVVVSPNPEMSKFVEGNSIGFVSEDFTPESFACVLNSLTRDQIMSCKINSDVLAKTENSEKNIQFLKELLKP